MAHEPGDGFARKKRPPEVAMTTVENLLARKEQLLDRLQKNPGPHERREIEGALAQINTALDLLEEPGESSDEK
jgi:hypothetical protein